MTGRVSLAPGPDSSGAGWVRWVAGGAAVLAAALLLAWAFVAIVGLGQLDETPEQAVCAQPRVGFGLALLGLAGGGVVVAGWMLRAAVSSMRRHDAGLRFLAGVPATLVLGTMLVLVVVYRPELHYAPC
jgi:hypothetical protein